MAFPHLIRSVTRSASSKIALLARSATVPFTSRSFCSSSQSEKNSTTPSAASYYHLSGGPSHMRAAVFWEPGKPLTFEDFHMPRPKANEVLIKTKGNNNLSSLFVCHGLQTISSAQALV